MTSSVFPDLNVWIALTLRAHEHHSVAWSWYRNLPGDADLVFCRITQLGFLRLMTQKSVAGAEIMTQNKAWSAYDRWLNEGGAVFYAEPAGLEDDFRAKAKGDLASPKDWSDSYLAAFATKQSIKLVTFDKALQRSCKGSLLLTPKP